MNHGKKLGMRVLGFVLTLAMVLCIMPEKITAYADSAEPVGQLKILARYNDSMQFYDGHVYLLFTSYKNGVEITVNDLYAGYEIKDRYYEDIAKDISYGSNHNKETTADDYFTESKEMCSVTLDRGEIVTIGMYRGFDLSVADAALGCVKNSTIAKRRTGISYAAQAAYMESIYSYLNSGSPSSENSLMRLIAEMKNKGIDPSLFFDGTVEGGVCFNRELYNQKLEWDQYENVTYAVDITEQQLDRMVSTLQGNLNKFSMLKNSCATVAVNAWNAAVGTDSDGSRNSRYLEASGTGIYTYMDAPKTVKKEIMDKLPGYWLNNSQGVAEPGAGYEDETGWVYVSAPKKLDAEETAGKTTEQLIKEAKANTITVTDISSNLPGTVTVGWESEYPADGYDVVLWNSRRMGGNVLVSRFDIDGSESGINIYGLMPNNRYYVRVRAYKTIDGERVYGKYSSTQSVTVKGLGFGRVFSSAASFGRPYLSATRYTTATDPYFFYRF